MQPLTPVISVYNSQLMCASLAALGDPSTNQLQQTLLRSLTPPAAELFTVRATFSLPRAFYYRDGDALYVGITGVEDATQASQVMLGASSLVQVGTWRANVVFVNAARALVDVIRQTVNTPVRDVLIGGHSYGGAIAEVAAVLGRTEGLWRAAHVITFGSPRPGDFTFAAAMRDVTVARWMNVEDPIPRFPPQPGEAPAAYLVAPFFATSAWFQYVQPYGGVTLSPLGGVAAGELPPQLLPITEVRLLVWASGYQGFGNPAHGIESYLQRILLVPSPQFGQSLSDVNRVLRTVSGEGPQPADSPDSVSELRKAVSLAQGVSAMSVLIPLPNRPSLVKVTSKIYRVQWGSELITTGMSRTNARAFRKSLYKALRVLQTQQNVAPAAFGTALTTYLAAATNPAGGFRPVLSLMS